MPELNPLDQKDASAVAPKTNKTISVHIPSGGTESEAVFLGGATLVEILWPSAFTGATIGFKSSNNGADFQIMNNIAGTDYAVTVPGTLPRNTALAPMDFISAEYIKITCSAQAADRIINIVPRVFS